MDSTVLSKNLSNESTEDKTHRSYPHPHPHTHTHADGHLHLAENMNKEKEQLSSDLLHFNSNSKSNSTPHSHVHTPYSRLHSQINSLSLARALTLTTASSDISSSITPSETINSAPSIILHPTVLEKLRAHTHCHGRSSNNNKTNNNNNTNARSRNRSAIPLLDNCTIDNVVSSQEFQQTVNLKEEEEKEVLPDIGHENGNVNKVHSKLRSQDIIIPRAPSLALDCEMRFQYFVNMYAANDPTEDAYSVHIDQQARIAYFGVFDGHSGTAASQYAKNELIHYIRYKLYNECVRNQSSLGDQEQPLVNTDTTANSSCDQLSLYRLMERALCHGFEEADRVFLESAVYDTQRLRDSFTGSCALVTAIIGNHIFIANAGDCRAVLGRTYITPISCEGGNVLVYEAVQMTNDHTATSEQARLHQEHPNDPEVVSNGRIKGRLEPSRGLGDALFKSKFFNLHLVPESRIEEPYDPPYTTAVPDIIHYQLQRGDSFLILSTDGLWNILSNEEAVQTVAECLKRNSNSFSSVSSSHSVSTCQHTSTQYKTFCPATSTNSNINTTTSTVSSTPGKSCNLATALLRKALVKCAPTLTSSVNTSSMGDVHFPSPTEYSNEEEQERLSVVIQMPQHYKRLIFDDMTIIVIYLSDTETDIHQANLHSSAIRPFQHNTSHSHSSNLQPQANMEQAANREIDKAIDQDTVSLTQLILKHPVSPPASLLHLNTLLQQSPTHLSSPSSFT